MAHYSNCAKCGTYGHDAKVCPTQANAVEPDNNGAQMGKDTSDAQCMDVGGGSFYIDCIETNNRYSELSEDDGNSSWTDWRGYYKSTPAPPIPSISIRAIMTDEQACEAFNQSELAPDDEFEWIKVRKVVKDRKPVIGKPVIGEPVIGMNSNCTSPVNGMNSTCINSPVIGTNSNCINSPVTGMNSNCIPPVSGVCGAGKVVRDLVQPVSGNIGIIGISDEPPKEGNTKDILEFEAIRPDGAPWVYSSNGRRIVEVTMDSGAAATVVPRGTSIAKLGPVTRENCKNFRVANGSRIPNLGEQFITGKTSNGRDIKFRAQVADVTKPLAAVHEMVESDCTVVFAKGRSYIRSDASGKEIDMRAKNGQFVLDVHMDEIMAHDSMPPPPAPFRRQVWP